MSRPQVTWHRRQIGSLVLFAALSFAALALTSSASISDETKLQTVVPGTAGETLTPSLDGARPGATAAPGAHIAADEDPAPQPTLVPRTWVTGAKPLAPAGTLERFHSSVGYGDYACPAGSECGE